MPPRLPLGSHPLLVCLLLAAPLHGQSPGEKAELQARYDAHQADFDYLLGDWEFVQTRPTPDGPVEFGGFWSAARSADGALITDEFRSVDDSGATSYVGTTVRAYSPSEQRWNLVSVEPGWGGVHTGVARKEGDEIRVEQTFGPTLWRIRYFDIRPDRFSWRADISRDGGKTWIENHRRIEARRIAAPRPPAAMTPRGR